MAHKISSPDLPERRRQRIEHANGALVYLGIVATFAVVSLIAGVIWLLIQHY